MGLGGRLNLNNWRRRVDTLLWLILIALFLLISFAEVRAEHHLLYANPCNLIAPFAFVHGDFVLVLEDFRLDEVEHFSLVGCRNVTDLVSVVHLAYLRRDVLVVEEADAVGAVLAGARELEASRR